MWTFHPCHLWMRWSTVEPQEHLIPVIVRGLPLKTDKRFCFVAYQDNEQTEGGDTYVHVFLKEPWPHCETRWFYFHGTMSAEYSPSTSAIFKKHREAPEFWRIILEPWTLDLEPPHLTRIILEPWTSTEEQPEWSLLFKEEWTS